MAISFDDLPDKKPEGYDLLDEGIHNAVIKNATMEISKTTRQPYMAVQFTCTDPVTKKSTTVFDNFFDSDKPLTRYKLGQFIRALKLQLTGSFELKDLCKVIPNKELCVALKTEQNEGYAARNVVNAYDDSIYYEKEFDAPPFDATSPSDNGAPVY